MTDRHQPHEHDLGLAHDLNVLSRRRIFQLAGVAGASALVAACAGGTSKQASGSTSTTTTAGEAGAAACTTAAPAETAGPYPGDGSNGPNVLIESGVVRSDIRPSFCTYSGVAEGVPTGSCPSGGVKEFGRRFPRRPASLKEGAHVRVEEDIACAAVAGRD